MTKPITAIRVLSVCVPTMLSLSVAQAQPVDKVEFDLHPNPAFKNASVQIRKRMCMSFAAN